MKKLLLITILIIPIVLSLHPLVANSETSVTGGGIIKDGRGKQANKILFGVNIFTDEVGTPSTGILQIYFLNTYYDYLGLDNFNKKKFSATEITGGVIETRFLGGDPNNPYTFVRIEANGQLNGEDDWYIEVRFADEPVVDGAILQDAVRITIFQPNGDDAYDTASSEELLKYDYPRDHSWRTFFDGGNVTVFYEE